MIKGRLATAYRLIGDYQDARDLHKELLSHYRDIGEKFAISDQLLNLRMTLLALGEERQVAKFLQEGILIWKETRSFIFYIGLIYVAEILRKREKPKEAALILGNIDLGEKGNWGSFTVDDFEKLISEIRGEIGVEAFAVAYESGKQLSLDEAADFALQELEQ